MRTGQSRAEWLHPQNTQPFLGPSKGQVANSSQVPPGRAGAGVPRNNQDEVGTLSWGLHPKGDLKAIDIHDCDGVRALSLPRWCQLHVGPSQQPSEEPRVQGLGQGVPVGMVSEPHAAGCQSWLRPSLARRTTWHRWRFPWAGISRPSHRVSPEGRGGPCNVCGPSSSRSTRVLMKPAGG